MQFQQKGLGKRVPYHIRSSLSARLAGVRRKVDDGFSIENLPDGGGQRIWVHIADVSRWIPEDSPLHLEARRRRATTYLPEGSVPMFPSEVAHGVLSLR